MGKAATFGQTGQNTKATGPLTTSTASVFILGQMAGTTKASGLTTTCMARVFTPGRTGDDTKAPTKTTARRATESTPGLTVASMLVFGATVSNMEKASMSCQMGSTSSATGKMEIECAGKTDKSD